MPDIKTLKFSEADFIGQDVSSLPDRPSAEGIQAEELKARFDNVGKTMLAQGRFNELIDALQSIKPGDTGAKNIKMVNRAGEPTDVQTNLLALANQISTGGYGDMLKSEYDTTGSGSVDNADNAAHADSAAHADNADKLGECLPGYYQSEMVGIRLSANQTLAHNTLTVVQYGAIEYKSAAGLNVTASNGTINLDKSYRFVRMVFEFGFVSIPADGRVMIQTLNNGSRVTSASHGTYVNARWGQHIAEGPVSRWSNGLQLTLQTSFGSEADLSTTSTYVTLTFYN